MIDPEDNAIWRINELEREMENIKGAFRALNMRCERITTERDTLVERAEVAEALAVEWQRKHADLYVASEEDRQRAMSAESKLDALQDLLRKATKIAGGDDMASESFDEEITLYAGNVAAQPKYWRNK